MSASPNNGNNDYELCWLPFIGHGAWQHQHTHTYIHMYMRQEWKVSSSEEKGTVTTAESWLEDYAYATWTSRQQVRATFNLKCFARPGRGKSNCKHETETENETKAKNLNQKTTTNQQAKSNKYSTHFHTHTTTLSFSLPLSLTLTSTDTELIFYLCACARTFLSPLQSHLTYLPCPYRLHLPPLPPCLSPSLHPPAFE